MASAAGAPASSWQPRRQRQPSECCAKPCAVPYSPLHCSEELVQPRGRPHRSRSNNRHHFPRKQGHAGPSFLLALASLQLLQHAEHNSSRSSTRRRPCRGGPCGHIPHGTPLPFVVAGRAKSSGSLVSHSRCYSPTPASVESSTAATSVHGWRQSQGGKGRKLDRDHQLDHLRSHLMSGRHLMGGRATTLAISAALPIVVMSAMSGAASVTTSAEIASGRWQMAPSEMAPSEIGSAASGEHGTDTTAERRSKLQQRPAESKVCPCLQVAGAAAGWSKAPVMATVS